MLPDKGKIMVACAFGLIAILLAVAAALAVCTKSHANPEQPGPMSNVHANLSSSAPVIIP